MSIEFFKLPRRFEKSDLGRLPGRVEKEAGSKKARHPLKQVTGLQDEFSTTHLVSQFTTERR